MVVRRKEEDMKEFALGFVTSLVISMAIFAGVRHCEYDKFDRGVVAGVTVVTRLIQEQTGLKYNFNNMNNVLLLAHEVDRMAK